MPETIEIQIGQETCQMEAGLSLADVFGEWPGTRDIVAALLNNRLVSLSTRLHNPVTVQPIRRDSPHAQSILVRSSHHLLYTAMSRCFPGLLAEVGQSLPAGHFHVLLNREELGLEVAEIAEGLTAECNRLIELDLPFVPQRIPVEAISSMVADPLGYRERLLQTWSTPMVPLIQLDHFVDVQHGPYVPSTGYLGRLLVRAEASGIVLELTPGQSDPGRGKALLQSYNETREWNRKLGVSTVGDLNSSILDGRIEEVLRVAEAFHEKKIGQISDAICGQSDKVRMVCIAGPSSAGKTTFVRRLSIQMLVNGVQPVALGLDDYYRNRSDMPRGKDGEIDFEALEALDLELLSDHLTRLVEGDEVRIPRFDFRSGKRVPESEWKSFQLAPNQVLMIEGLHGLNPGLAPGLPRSAKFLVFINALTQLIIDEHNRFPTSKVRLLRRIVRDRRFRGFPASQTLAMWPKVRAGESRYIFPFQGEADALFNSSLVYETAVLRNLAWRFLLEVPRTDPNHCEAYQLLKFLELFIPVEGNEVPSNSVLREFLGGSLFDY
jgi:uridine kinase